MIREPSTPVKIVALSIVALITVLVYRRIDKSRTAKSAPDNQAQESDTNTTAQTQVNNDQPHSFRKKWIAPTPILLFTILIIIPLALTLYAILSNVTPEYHDTSAHDIFRILVNCFLLYILPGAVLFAIFAFGYSKEYKPLPKFDHQGNLVSTTNSGNSKPIQSKPTPIPFSKNSIIRFSLIQSFTGCFMAPIFSIIITIQTLGFGATLFPIFLLSSIVFCLNPKWLPKTSYEFLLYRRARVIGMILGIAIGVLVGLNSNAPIGEPTRGATGFIYYKDATAITGSLALLSILINVTQTIIYKKIAKNKTSK